MGGQYTMHFGAELSAVADARRFATDTLGKWELESDDVALVVNELAANAVVHAHSPFSVTLRRKHPDAVEIEVGDHVPGAPEVEHPSPQATGGRGLLIVERLAISWGVRSGPGGKTIWAVLAASLARRLRPAECSE